MNHVGEIISLLVAVSWTFTAWFSDKATRRVGTIVTNALRLSLALLLLAIVLWIFTGTPFPSYTCPKAWLWLAVSALVGYVFGDYCLFNCYLNIGPRFGQLFMTMAPPMAAVAAWILLGERLSWMSLIAMSVTLSGIAISILSRDSSGHVKSDIPLKGILYGLGAGTGQGVGLVLSKVGMQHYAEAIPADAPAVINAMLPFSSTFMRAVVGALSFLILVAVAKDMGRFKSAVRDRVTMKYVTILTLFGPAFGVSLSLLAVRYANAGIASTLMALTPVIIIIPDVLVNKKRLRFKEILGLAVSIAGVALFFLL